MRVLIPLLVVLTLGGVGGQRLSAEVLIKIEDRSHEGERREGDPAHVIFTLDDDIWVGLESGLYLVRGNSLSSVWRDTPVTAMVPGLQKNLWFGTRGQGIFAESRGAVKPIHQETFLNTSIHGFFAEKKPFDGRHLGIWVATDRGLYRVTKSGVEAFISDEPVFRVKEGPSGILAATSTNVYTIISTDRREPLLPQPLPGIEDFTQIGGSLWLTSRSRAASEYGPCHELNGGTLKEYPKSAPCLSVADVSGDVWLASALGISYLVGDELSRLEAYDGPAVNTIFPTGDRIWIGTSRGAILRDGFEYRPIPAERPFLSVREFVPIDDTVWLRTDNGVYRFDENVTIAAYPNGFRWPPLIDTPIVWSPNVNLVVEYATSGGNAYKDGIDGRFQVILGSDSSEVRFKANKGAFENAADSSIRLSGRKSIVYWQAKDRFGNLSEVNSVQLQVIPMATSALVIGGLFLLLSVAIFRRSKLRSPQTSKALRNHSREAAWESVPQPSPVEEPISRDSRKSLFLLPVKEIAGGLLQQLSRVATVYTRSESLNRFYSVGYLLLGAILITLAVLGFLLGDSLSAPIQDEYPILHHLFEALLSKTPLGPVIPLPLPVASILPILWFLGLWNKSVRGFFGKHTTSTLLRLISRGITIGEWCILHRWFSFLWMALLVAYLAGAIVWLSTTEKRADLLSSDYNTWLDHVEDFVLRNTLSRYDPAPHKELHDRYWRDDFLGLFGEKSTYERPGKALYDTLHILYEKDRPYTRKWIDWISFNGDRFFRIADRNYRPTKEMTAEELREWTLLQLLLGRLFVRLGGDDCSNIDALEISLRYLEAIDGEAERIDPVLNRAAMNAKGTVYSCLFSYRLGTGPANLTISPRPYDPRCGTAPECLERAYTFYTNAASGPSCSFQEKRLKNNLLDLFSRAGQQYDRIAKSIAGGSPLAIYFSNQENLAVEIERRDAELMSCLSSGPLLPEIFITSSQALAVAAHLHLSQARQMAALEKSGHYLALAYAFLPDAFAEWSVQSYCPVLGSEERRHSFEKGTRSLPTEFVDFEMSILVDRLQKQCGQGLGNGP